MNGFTGKEYDGAEGQIKKYLAQGFKIVTLDGKDIEKILQCKDITQIVEEKYINLFKD